MLGCVNRLPNYGWPFVYTGFYYTCLDTLRMGLKPIHRLKHRDIQKKCPNIRVVQGPVHTYFRAKMRIDDLIIIKYFRSRVIGLNKGPSPHGLLV